MPQAQGWLSAGWLRNLVLHKRDESLRNIYQLLHYFIASLGLAK